jgi:hypothetical protein
VDANINPDVNEDINNDNAADDNQPAEQHIEDNYNEDATNVEDENEYEEDDDELDPTIEDESIPIQQETDDDVTQRMEAQYGARRAHHNLRPRKPRDYGHLHTTLESITMTQHSVKKGLKKFGAAGVSAVLDELQQLHDRQVIEPKGPTEITEEERRAALRYLMFLKEKRCGKIKGRRCADGRKQREYTSKDETSSPTNAIESVMLSCTIDALERRNVATANIPGAFMQTDMEGTVHMMLEGKMAKLLVKIDPKLYRKYLMNRNGKPIM